MISLKKYLDMEIAPRSAEDPKGSTLLPSLMESYRSALCSFGKSAVQACPRTGADLEESLTAVENRLFPELTTELVTQTETQVAARLEEWGKRTAEHFQAKTDEVKELLIVLAHTAESLGERDQQYASQFSDLTARLKAIATLDDLTQIRSSLMQRANELKSCLDQMSRDNQESVTHLRAEVTSYQAKLKEVERLASKDTLTALANRRSIEARIEALIVQKESFCVVMLDLNGFKEINDAHGHGAGDDLLRQFAKDLETNMRTTDVVGRWGGDEFVVVLAGNLNGATSHMERIRKWVFGKYTIPSGVGKDLRDVQVSASVGLAQWRPGQSLQNLITEADAAMYQDKRAARK